MLPAAILMLLSYYPIFCLITRHPSLSTLLAGPYSGLSPANRLCLGFAGSDGQHFSARTRVTGLSLSYNLGVLLFGGFAPLVFTWLPK